MTREVYRHVGRNAFRRGTFDNLVYRIHKGEIIAGDELASVLKNHFKEALPPDLLDHICRHLEGKIHKPRGRKSDDTLKYLRDTIAVVYYERYLEWLQQREKRMGLGGWVCIRDADWWQGPPHERAARMTTKRLYPNHHWRSIGNIVSSQK